MKLSICMMIKDEEKNLQRCLNSLSPLMESLDLELIIIDTGSTDESPNIAKKFTNKVFFHKWNNDFSEMRNVSISYAKGEWILIIDADEELKSCNEIIAFLASNECKKYNAATILCENVMGNSEYNSVVLVTPRLFKNDGKFKYTGSVHNMPIFSQPVKNLKDTLLHYGYIITDKELVEKKFKRTATMLRKELEKNPNNVYYRYQLSVSYLAHGNLMEALNECERCYKNMKENILNLREHFYVYPHLVKCLCKVNNYHRAKLICEEAIKVEKEQLDMYCYLGEVLLNLNESDEAVKAFDKYLYLVKNYNKLSIINDTMMYFEKLGYVEKVYHYLAMIHYSKENYTEVLKYSSLIKLEEIVKESMPVFLESFIKLSKYQELKDYYKKVIYENKNVAKSFCDYLEKVLEGVRYNELFELYKVMAEGNDEYSILNKIRVAIVENKAFETEVLNNYISNLNFNDSPEYYGDILYYYMNFDIDFYSFLFSVNEVKIVKYLLYLQNKNSEFVAALERYSKDFSGKTDFKYIRVNKIIFKVLMATGNYDDERYKDIFIKYVELGVSYINYVYNNELIENEWLADIKNDEEAFLIFIHKANKIKNYDKKSYVMYVREALKVYPYMKKGIEILIEKEEILANEKEREFENYKISLKKAIAKLIDNNELRDAQELILQYEDIVKNDVEIYSMKAIIYMMQQKNNEAEEVLLEGLKIDSNNTDLLFNLAYVYETNQNFHKALEYYKIAFLKSDNEDTRENIKSIIRNLLEDWDSDIKIEEFLETSKGNSNSKKQKILVLCHFYSVYTKEYLEKIYNKVDFDILTIDNGYKTNVKNEVLENIYTYKDLQEMFNFFNLCEKYDVIHVHFLAPFYGDVAEQIRNKCEKLIITIWGSDYYRTTSEQREEQRKLIDRADIITFDNEVTMDEFAKYYDITNKERLSINRFGLTALEYIKDLENSNKDSIKAEYNIPKNSIVVTCGYNANPAHNHLEIIKSIKQVKNKLPENMYYIFPMTYSRDEAYCDAVKEELSKSGLQYIVLEKFMNFEQIAKLTIITDIMVQLQTTDTLSATMQEHMYNGNIVITGSWLPYKPLKDIGTYFLEISSINKVGKKLTDVAKELLMIKQRCKKNRNIIWKFSAWENTVENWIKTYDKIDNTKLSEFNHKAYWENRYSNKFDLESSGTMGLGITYNKFLYKSRLDILHYLKKHLLGNLVNKNVLELGTGTGYFTNYFHKQNIKSYYGIDISQKSIDNLSLIYKKFKFKSGDISDINVYETNKTYDLIFASDVLLHLTNDEKFEKSIHNIGTVLSKDGYFIDIEPITMVDVETSAPHNRIIKYEELKTALEKENLEIVDIIPVTFFMDYPFDYKIMGDVGVKALNDFNEISSYLQDNIHDSREKEKNIEKIYYIDKWFLKCYETGLSNKLVIIKKKENPKNYKVNIDNVWTENKVSCSSDFEKFNLSKLINSLKKNGNCDLVYEQPLVTVAIINYNYSRYIDECISSILTQTYKNTDILIIDDCSNKDDSIEKIRNYTCKYKNIRAIYHPINKGLTQGIRDSIEYANGKYFIIISADDYLYTENAIEEFAYVMENDTKVNYVHCNLVNVDKYRNYKGVWSYKQYTTDQMVNYTFNSMGVAMVPSTAGMYRTEFFRKNNITWYENKEMGIAGDDGLNSLYFAKYGWNYKYIDRGLIGYRQHNNNLSFNFETRIKFLISSIEFIINNFNEKIYLPEIEWSKLSEKQRVSLKMFKIGQKYWEMFLIHYKDAIKPWKEIEFNLSENLGVFKLLEKYIKSYFSKSTEADNLCSEYIKTICNELGQCLNNINNK